MRITCPHCDAVLKSNADLPADKAIRCPKCEATFTVAAPRKANAIDDDDDYDVPPARRKQNSSSVAKIVVPIVAICLLVFGAIAGGAIFVYYKYLRDDDKGVVGTNVKAVGPQRGIGAGKQPRKDLGPGPVLGKETPEIEGEDIDGKRFKLSDYRGKVVVLDFWGNW
jgi:predicted Zn finger-like uncharacterized protein